MQHPDDVRYYVPYPEDSMWSWQDHHNEFVERGGLYYVPLSPSLIDDVMNLNFGHDGTLDFDSRHRGITPFAVMPDDVVPPTFMHLLNTLKSYFALT